jgi:hypothetical protein
MPQVIQIVVVIWRKKVKKKWQILKFRKENFHAGLTHVENYFYVQEIFRSILQIFILNLKIFMSAITRDVKLGFLALKNGNLIMLKKDVLNLER